MSTLETLRAQCRTLLASTTAWPDTTLDAFIQDAVRFYSIDFPRLLTHTITCTKGTYTYDLTTGHNLRTILRVQLEGEQLTEVDPASDLLDSGGLYYAITPPDDTLAGDEDAYPGSITIAPDADTGDHLTITYTSNHRVPVASEGVDYITVPQSHWEALIAFVDFRCHWRLESDEAVTPDNTSIILSQLGDNSRRAWNRYREIIARIAFTNTGQSHIVTWDASRIY